MTAISFGGVGLLVVLVFRSVFRPAVGLIALVMGVCWAFGFAAVTVGHLNMMSMVLAPMLIGIGIDYGIHLVARYEEERGTGHPIREALERAFEGAGPGILHAALTTSVGLFTLVLTGGQYIAGTWPDHGLWAPPDAGFDLRCPPAIAHLVGQATGPGRFGETYRGSARRSRD
ncbi:MAG: MMPL family transporter [Candidatus Methylomirabilis sp.]|nr:MMPL family transporter [Candidatus Methylomirabilis sp.]